MPARLLYLPSISCSRAERWHPEGQLWIPLQASALPDPIFSALDPSSPGWQEGNPPTFRPVQFLKGACWQRKPRLWTGRSLPAPCSRWKSRLCRFPLQRCPGKLHRPGLPPRPKALHNSNCLHCLARSTPWGKQASPQRWNLPNPRFLSPAGR